MKCPVQGRGWGLGSENNFGQRSLLGVSSPTLPNAMPAVKPLGASASSLCFPVALLGSGGMAFLGCLTAKFKALPRKALGLQDPALANSVCHQTTESVERAGRKSSPMPAGPCPSRKIIKKNRE